MAKASAEKTLQQAHKSLVQVANALDGAGLTSLTDDERQHTAGRLRQGEDKAMHAILDCMDAMPSLFASLADKDHGKDPNKVETLPAREALARAQSLIPIVEAADRIARMLADDLLAAVAKARDVTVPAYAIAKANASANAKLRGKIAPAMDFYARTSRRKPGKAPKTGNAKNAANG